MHPPDELDALIDAAMPLLVIPTSRSGGRRSACQSWPFQSPGWDAALDGWRVVAAYVSLIDG